LFTFCVAQEAAFVTFARKQTTAQTSIIQLHAQESRIFSLLLKVAILLGLIVGLNGPQYSQLALRILYGNRWAEADGATAALACFAVMISILAVNGITEAFVHAVMTPKELASANLVLLISSVLNVV